MPRREHPGDRGERRLAARPLLPLADLLEGRRQLERQLRRQRVGAEGSDPAEQDQLSDPPARGAERCSQERGGVARRRARRNDSREARTRRRRFGHGHEPVPEPSRRAPGAGGDDDGLLAPRPERERPGRRPRHLQAPAQGRGEPLGYRGSRENRRHQIAQLAPVLHAVTAASAIGRGGCRCAVRP